MDKIQISLERPDEYYMKEALKEAEMAFKKGEIPVGAVIVHQNKIIARAYNQTEQLKDVTAHAEMVAITSAANHLSNKYLNECTIYITLEPCVMCAGALQWAQIKRIVVGTADPKKGFSTLSGSVLHPKTQYVSGILAKECETLLKSFFERLRDN